MAAELLGALGPLVAAWVALVGAVLGSFLNVVIARVPARESIVRPGSRCPRCRAPIRWYDNVPVLSWLALRGRCRNCRAPISARYPAVEALGAVIALLAFTRHGLSGTAVAEFVFAAGMLALAFIDLDTWLLPDVLTRPLVLFGGAMGLLGATPAGSLKVASYGAGLGYAGFALVAWLGERAFKKEALGQGDVWLLAGIGAWVGPAALLPVVLLASIQGSVVGVALIALGKAQPGPPAPPAPGDPGSAPLSGAPPAPASPAAPDGDAPPVAPVLAAAPAPPGADDVDAEWVPPKHAVPFGPFLVAGALEWLWLGDVLSGAVPILRPFR